MFDALCHTSDVGALGNLGVWGGVGLILNLVFWVGLIAGLTLLVVLAIRRGRVGSTMASASSSQLNAKEALQAQYARGEITREQYERKKQGIG